MVMSASYDFIIIIDLHIFIADSAVAKVLC